MTLKEALLSLSPYPITEAAVDKILVDRALLEETVYDATVATSDNYRLAEADTYMWLSIAPDLKEQEVSLSLEDRDNFKQMADKVYGELDDDKFNGVRYGYIGEDFNG